MPNAKDELRIALLKIVEELELQFEPSNAQIIKIAREKYSKEIKSASEFLIDIAMRRIINDALYGRKIEIIGQGDLFGKRSKYISIGRSRKRTRVGELSLIKLATETTPKEKIVRSSKNLYLNIRARILIDLIGDENLTVDEAEIILSKDPKMLESYKERVEKEAP
jgi:hypothetical protein